MKLVKYTNNGGIYSIHSYLILFITITKSVGVIVIAAIVVVSGGN